MSRPPGPLTERERWLALNDPRYRFLLGGGATGGAGAACRHLGAYAGRKVGCPTCAGSVELKVFACAVHGECVLDKQPEGVASCKGCPDFAPASDARRLLEDPRGPRPEGWHGRPDVAEAFRQLFGEAARSIPAPPEFSRERGVVVCGGGWRFFPGVYVTVRMLRSVGCDWPVQVWYLGDRGEFDPRMAEILRPYGPVGWIDGNAFWRDSPGVRICRPELDDPWLLKPLAAAYCPFREVLSLDADCYPVLHPSVVIDHPEARRVGAVFWPDVKPLERGQWERFGLPDHDVPGLESGQFYVDKGKHWAPLWLALWLNAHHHYVYQHLYGDKDTFNVAWRRLRREMCVPTRRPGWQTHSYLQKGFDGRPVFVHRTRDKFKLTGAIDGDRIADDYRTGQSGPGAHFEPGLPREAEAFDYLHQCDELLRPGRHFVLRPGTQDPHVWAATCLRDEYRVPALGPDDLIIDVGAHIGSFAHHALRRGAGRVIACEAHPDNCRVLERNLAPWGGRVSLRRAAVWRSDGVPLPAEALLVEEGDGSHTGGNSLLRPRAGERAHPVRAVPLDDLIPGPVRLLKLDCEGSEWPILYSSRRLELVEEICGEYHEHDGPGWARVAGSPPHTRHGLKGFLESKGFRVELAAPYGPDHGLFWARR